MLNQGDQRDSYCRSVEALEYCDRINNFTTENFCECACRGNYKGWIQESIEERRNKMRKPLTGSEKRYLLLFLFGNGIKSIWTEPLKAFRRMLVDPSKS
jgi:hypothetical protein